MLIVIPARHSSRRLPGKVLLPLAGAPMVQHVWQRAVAARIGRVVIATDDRRVADAARSFGAEVAMTSSHHASGTDRVAEVASSADEDLILNLQADEPLITPSSLELVAGTLRERPEADIATLARRLREPSTATESVVKVTVDVRGYATDFFRQGAASTEDAWEHVGVYCYRRDSLLFLAKQPQTARERDRNLEQLRALDLGMTIVVAITEDQCIGVNTADELNQVRRILERGETAMPGPRRLPAA